MIFSDQHCVVLDAYGAETGVAGIFDETADGWARKIGGYAVRISSDPPHILADYRGDIRCPWWPQPGQTRQLPGCGSLNVTPSQDGAYDCRDCGLFFQPELVVLVPECRWGWPKDLPDAVIVNAAAPLAGFLTWQDTDRYGPYYAAAPWVPPGPDPYETFRWHAAGARLVVLVPAPGQP
jgi:hypothetical protein